MHKRRTPTHTHTPTHPHTHTHTHTRAHTHTHMYKNAHVHESVCLRVCVFVCIHMTARREGESTVAVGICFHIGASLTFHKILSSSPTVLLCGCNFMQRWGGGLHDPKPKNLPAIPPAILFTGMHLRPVYVGFRMFPFNKDNLFSLIPSPYRPYY